MLWPRWLFLRALALIYLSAFVSLLFQILGLVGEHGILPAGEFLGRVTEALPGAARFWRIPTLHWMGSSDTALVGVCLAGAIASGLLFLNLAPRASALLCWLSFLSSLSLLQVFASYQSDSMLLEAGLVALLLAPSGLRPGLGASTPPGGAAVFLLRWEWFRIYLESGVVKLTTGCPIGSASSRRTPARLPASMRPTSRGSNGTCGSPRWRIGARTTGCCGPRWRCFSASRPCLSFFAPTPSSVLSRKRCGRSAGNTGSRIERPGERPEIGGGDRNLDPSPRR